MAQKTPQKITAFRRIALPLLLVLVLQSIVLYSLSQAGGIFAKIHENAKDLLEDRTRNKYQILQNDMNGWSSLQTLSEIVNARIHMTLSAQGKDYSDIRMEADLNAQIIDDVTDDLITRLRQDNTSGIFLVLDGAGVQGEKDTYASVYVRDTAPDTYVDNNSDLHMIRGLPPLTRRLGFPLDSFWKACFVFDEENGPTRTDFFFKPLEAAKASSNRSQSKYFGYWSDPFSLNQKDPIPVFTYSLPLIAADGTVYGVLGVEVNVDYVAGLLTGSANRNRDLDSAYFLGITEDGGKTYRHVLSAGARYKQFFDEGQPLVISQIDGANSVVAASGKTGGKIYGAAIPLTTYSRNTPFDNQQWTLIGFQDEETLFSFERQCQALILAVSVITLVMGVLTALLIARKLAKPITRLVDELKCSKPGELLSLRRTGISEIDVLADNVMELHHSVLEEASKISKIIALTGLSVGVFEMLSHSEQAFCSDDFFKILKAEDFHKAGSNHIAKAECMHILEESLRNPLEDTPDVYQLGGPSSTRYISCRMLTDEHGTIGTLLDVTSEVCNRKRIEHDRDHDTLTDIYNRRAFEKRAAELFGERRDELRVAALLVLDLDNFRSINDSYGHDCGDSYIRAFGKMLQSLQSTRSIVARRSGAEFLIFFFGFDSREELWDVIQRDWKRAMDQTLYMPDGKQLKLRASGGVAWYPDDAQDISRLVQFADFAMYHGKKMAKGHLLEFSLDEYEKETRPQG